MNEPIADAARSILDGHIVLSRRLASAGHYPCIDVLDSVSRVSSQVTTRPQAAAATELRRLLAADRDAQGPRRDRRLRPGLEPDGRPGPGPEPGHLGVPLPAQR